MLNLLAKITEAYCIENNLPIRRQFTHEELKESVRLVRNAADALYGRPIAAEACTELGATDRPESTESRPSKT